MADLPVAIHSTGCCTVSTSRSGGGRSPFRESWTTSRSSSHPRISRSGSRTTSIARCPCWLLADRRRGEGLGIPSPHLGCQCGVSCLRRVRALPVYVVSGLVSLCASRHTIGIVWLPCLRFTIRPEINSNDFGLLWGFQSNSNRILSLRELTISNDSNFWCASGSCAVCCGLFSHEDRHTAQIHTA